MDPHVGTGTFLLNDHFASVLFDTGADRNFISHEFASLLSLPIRTITNTIHIELANGEMIEANQIIQGCALNLNNHIFEINILPVELGSFDIVVGMDWLAKNQAEVICRNKTIRIPLPNNETLIVQGDRTGINLGLISV